MLIGSYVPRGAVMMNPGMAKNLVEQRHAQLAQCRGCQTGISRPRADRAAPGWLIRHVPRWRISWSWIVLSPGGATGTAADGHPDRPGRHSSSLMIIIRARRSV